MEVEWKVDPETLRIAWKRLNNIPILAAKSVRPVNRILDIGGGSGWFARTAAKHHPNAQVFCVDLEPRVGDNWVIHIKGSGLDLPFRDASIDVVTVHAMLHHVPGDLDLCLKGINRVLRPGGMLIVQEPLSRNPFSNMAGKLVTTTRHDPGERPLDPAKLGKAIAGQFRIINDEYFFLTSYLCQHIIPLLPKGIRKLARMESRFLIKLDKKLLKTMPKLRYRASYASIVAVKR